MVPVVNIREPRRRWLGARHRDPFRCHRLRLPDFNLFDGTKGDLVVGMGLAINDDDTVGTRSRVRNPVQPRRARRRARPLPLAAEQERRAILES